MSDSAAITWPQAFAPARSPVFVSNRLEMRAKPADVWAWLIHAASWPQWYANSHDVVVQGGGDLALGKRFTWRTFGVSLTTKVEEFVPESRIAWLAEGSGVRAYHAWLITPREGGCTVLTEETQHGLVSRIGKLIYPNRMKAQHQLWLEGLEHVAQGGPPPKGEP